MKVSRRNRSAVADHARVCRVPGLNGVELLSATVDEHVFPRHAHDALAIGVMTSGTSEFWCRGAVHRAPADSLLLLPIGEVHTGNRWRGAGADGQPTTHRMFYFDHSTLERLLDVRLPPHGMDFTAIAPSSTMLAECVRRVHDLCEQPSAMLARETRLTEMLLSVVRCFRSDGTRSSHASRRAAGNRRDIARAIAFLHDRFADDVSIATLAGLVDLHPVYLIRAFRRVTGLPPHQYQLHLRLAVAKRRLASEPPSAVAHGLGFTDQSHLARHFRRAFGIAPGEYRASLLRSNGGRSGERGS